MKINKSLLMVFIVILMELVSINIYASENDQIGVHSKAIALGNAVTACPPGIMSIHYNPAGLAFIREGLTYHQGLSVSFVQKSESFKPDPSFQLRGNYFKSTDDPVANTDSTTKGSSMYIPFYGDIKFPVMINPLPAGLSYRSRGSRWTFANAAYTPFLSGAFYDDTDASRFGGKSGYSQHVMFSSPSVSYQASDTFAFGISLGLGQSAMGISTDIRSPNELTALLKDMIYTNNQGTSLQFLGKMGPFDRFADMELELRSQYEVTPSVNVGFLWGPIDWMTIGLAYQSPIISDMIGRYHFNYSKDFRNTTDFIQKNIGAIQAMFGGNNSLATILRENQYQSPDKNMATILGEMSTIAAQGGEAKMSGFEFPQHVRLGFQVRPISKLRLMGDVQWANWSAVQDYEIKFDQDIRAVMLAKLMNPKISDVRSIIYRRDYKDSINFNLGAEYQLKESLAVRMGYENRQTNVKEEYFDMYSLPTVHFFGAGCGMRLRSGMEVDFGVGYLVSFGYEVKNGVSRNLNNFKLPQSDTDLARLDNAWNPFMNPYSGQNYKTKTQGYLLSMNLTVPIK